MDLKLGTDPGEQISSAEPLIGMGFLLLSHSNLEAEAPHLEVTLRGLVSKKLLHAINSALLAMQTEWAHLAGLLPRPRLEQGGWRFGTSCSAEFHGEVLLFCFISPLESCDYKAESTNSSIQKSFQKYGNTMIFRAPMDAVSFTIQGVEGINSSIVGGAAGLVSLHPDASLQVRSYAYIDLSKALSPLFIIGVGWDVTLSRTEMMMQGKNYKPPDLDLEITCFDSHGRRIEFLSPKEGRETKCKGLRVTADSTGEEVGDDERALLDCRKVSKSIQTILICIGIRSGAPNATFRDVRNAYVRMACVTHQTEYEMWRMRLVQQTAGTGKTAYMCRICRTVAGFQALTLHGPDHYHDAKNPGNKRDFGQLTPDANPPPGPEEKREKKGIPTIFPNVPLAIRPLASSAQISTTDSGLIEVEKAAQRMSSNSKSSIEVGVGSPGVLALGLGFMDPESVRNLSFSVKLLDEHGIVVNQKTLNIRRGELGIFDTSLHSSKGIMISSRTREFPRDCARIFKDYKKESDGIDTKSVCGAHSYESLLINVTASGHEYVRVIRFPGPFETVQAAATLTHNVNKIHIAEGKFCIVSHIPNESVLNTPPPRPVPPPLAVADRARSAVFGLCVVNHKRINISVKVTVSLFNVFGEYLGETSSNAPYLSSKWQSFRPGHPYSQTNSGDFTLFADNSGDVKRVAIYHKSQRIGAKTPYSCVVSMKATGVEAREIFMRCVQTAAIGQPDAMDEKGRGLRVKLDSKDMRCMHAFRVIFQKGSLPAKVDTIGQMETVVFSDAKTNIESSGAPFATRIKYPVTIKISNIRVQIPACDKGGTTDPYVTFTLNQREWFQDLQKNGKYKERIVDKKVRVEKSPVLTKIKCPSEVKIPDYSPVFTSGKMQMCTPSARVLKISCYDKDKWSKDDKLFSDQLDLCDLDWDHEGRANVYNKTPSQVSPINPKIPANLDDRDRVKPQSYVKYSMTLEIVTV